MNLKKVYERPIIDMEEVSLEVGIGTASVVTGGSGSIPEVEEETLQRSDLVDWEFN